MMNNNNNKEITKTVVFDICDELSAKIDITFEEGDFTDEQLDYVARLHVAATQGSYTFEGKKYGNGFFEEADIIDHTSVENVEIYGKTFAFLKFRDVLLDKEEKRVLSSFMFMKQEGDDTERFGIVEVSSTVDSLDAPFQHHSDCLYEGIEPCTEEAFHDILSALSDIIRNETTNRNNMLKYTA